MRKVAIPLAILALIGLDQWVKHWVVANISLNQVIKAIPGVFQLDLSTEPWCCLFDFTGSEIFLCDFDGASDWCGYGFIWLRITRRVFGWYYLWF